MGCIYSFFKGKSKNSEEPRIQKQYSWDLRKEKNVDDFKLENLENSEVVKGPPSINGEQFIIRNCSNSKICLLDHTSMLTIDDSNDCLFILGPVKCSIFFRNCSNCTCVVACDQFRMRDCKRMNVFLHSTTTPSIESSTDIEFACYQLNYEGLRGQFKSANLSIFNNCWYSVHDFTPGEGSWSFLPPFCTLESLVAFVNTSLIFQGDLKNLCLDLNISNSAVPQTTGTISNARDSSESCVVAFLNDTQMPIAQENVAVAFIKELTINQKDVVLVASRSTVLTTKQISEIFNDKIISSSSEYSYIIALHFHGSKCIETCNRVAFKLSILPQSILISGSKLEATKQADQFFSLTNMLSF